MSSKSRKGTTSQTELITSADRWTLFESMIKELGLVRQHLNSFDDFIENQLNNIVAEVGKIEPDIEGYYVSRYDAFDVAEKLRFALTPCRRTNARDKIAYLNSKTIAVKIVALYSAILQSS